MELPLPVATSNGNLDNFHVPVNALLDQKHSCPVSQTSNAKLYISLFLILYPQKRPFPPQATVLQVEAVCEAFKCACITNLSSLIFLNRTLLFL